MARQLVYTSVPAGLTPGRTGFCTVARHRDLRDRLVTAIEALSSFPSDWRPAPVIWAFRWLDIGGTPYAVLSRLADAGHDYTHRTNFLAHHLVLDADETITAPRPAEIMLRWDGWLERWDGPPRWFDTEDAVNVAALPAADAHAFPAEAWQLLTGDAGRAALLLDDSRGPVRCRLRHTIEQEAHLLRLIRESSALLPVAEAWRAQFITTLQSGDSPSAFTWAGVRALTAADTPRADCIVLDFTDPDLLPPAPDNDPAQKARAAHPSGPAMFGNLGQGSEDDHAPEARRFSSRAEGAPVRESIGLGVWLGLGAVLICGIGVLAWLFLGRHDDEPMSRTAAVNHSLAPPPPPSPAEVLGSVSDESARLQQAWNEIERLAQAGRPFNALERWRALDAAAPQFTAMRQDYLKSKLLADAQQEWLGELAQITAKLSQGRAARAGLLAQLEAMKLFPRTWPVADPAGLERAWNTTAGIFKLLDALPDAPVWIVDNFTETGAGDGYQDFTATVTIPDLQAILAAEALKARLSAAPATSLALPPRERWFDFEVREEDRVRGDYLILHDSTRGTLGKLLQLFAETGGKTNIKWRVFKDTSEFIQRMPANAALKGAGGGLWVRIAGEPPQHGLYLLLRRTDAQSPTAWKPVKGPLSWLAVEGAPATVRLPAWLEANLPLAAQPRQTLRLEPLNAGESAADSFDNPQARASVESGIAAYHAAWLLNVLDQQIRQRQNALIQTREQLAQLAPDNPLRESGRQAVERLNQELLQLQNTRVAAAAASWPRQAAPWRLSRLIPGAPPLPLLEFTADESGPTP